MAGNSWQSPVTGEPSFGTYHSLAYANRSTTLLVNTSTTPAATWSAAVTVSSVPTGAKSARCFLYRVGATNPDALVVEAASGVTLDTAANFHYKYTGIHMQAGGTSVAAPMVDIPLDANKQFKWCTVGTSSLTQIGPAVGYEL